MTIAKDILKQIDITNKNLKSHHDLLLKNHAPVKKGDEIKSNVTGNHFGKNIKVDRVAIEQSGKGHHFVAYGRVMTRDGLPGAYKATATFELKAAK